MGTFTLDGPQRFAFRRTRLRTGLSDPPVVSVEIQRSGADIEALCSAAAEGRFTTLALADDWEIPVQLCGISSRDVWAGEHAGGIEAVHLHAVLISERLTEWFGETGPPGQYIICQRAHGTQPSAFLQTVIESDLLRLGGTEDDLLAPGEGDCLLRQGSTPNRHFLDEAVTAIRWRDPRLLGWRVLHPDGGDSQIAMVMAREAVLLEPERWDFRATEAEFGVSGPGQPKRRIRITHIQDDGGYSVARDAVNEALAVVEPESLLFDTNSAIPAAPCLVSFANRIHLAAEVAIAIRSDEDGTAVIDRIDLELEERSNNFPPVPHSAILRASVEGWSEDGARLRAVPDGADWNLAAPAVALEAPVLSPALFAGDRGGVYLRPAAGDIHLVHFTQGGTPVLAGSPMIRDDVLEEKGLDICIAGAGVSVLGNDTAFELLQGEANLQAANGVALTGSVSVSGDLDVS